MFIFISADEQKVAIHQYRISEPRWKALVKSRTKNTAKPTPTNWVGHFSAVVAREKARVHKAQVHVVC